MPKGKTWIGWNHGAVLPLFSEGTKISPCVSKFLLDVCAYCHRGLAFQNLQFFQSSWKTKIPYSLWTWRWEWKVCSDLCSRKWKAPVPLPPLPPASYQKWCRTKITRIASLPMCWCILNRKTPRINNIVSWAVYYCNPEHIYDKTFIGIMVESRTGGKQQSHQPGKRCNSVKPAKSHCLLTAWICRNLHLNVGTVLAIDSEDQNKESN